MIVNSAPTCVDNFLGFVRWFDHFLTWDEGISWVATKFEFSYGE